VGQIWYRSLDPEKQHLAEIIFCIISLQYYIIAWYCYDVTRNQWIKLQHFCTTRASEEHIKKKYFFGLLKMVRGKRKSSVTRQVSPKAVTDQQPSGASVISSNVPQDLKASQRATYAKMLREHSQLGN